MKPAYTHPTHTPTPPNTHIYKHAPVTVDRLTELCRTEKKRHPGPGMPSGTSVTWPGMVASSSKSL